MRNYDVIVVGLGAMGSAAAYHLAKAGQRVLGLDRFEPPHQLGSSHGLTRIIREAYFEHPAYVPLVQRAYQLWAELEKEAGRKLLVQTGGLMIGTADGTLVSGARRSAEQHHLAYETLSADELRRRFPFFKPTPEMIAIWEPRAGVLFPEWGVQTHLNRAASHGATLRFNEPVLRWEPKDGDIGVITEKGTYSARCLLLAAGAWTGPLVPNLALPLTVERQVLYWFEPTAQLADFAPTRCAIYICEYAPHRYFYGFPDLGDGVKVAIHHEGDATDPDHVRREVAEGEIENMRSLMSRFLPSANGRLKSTAVCIYTNTPDEHFILDFHPAVPQVLIASPCSGHGFKFSPAIGEIAARLLLNESPRYDLSLFSLGRFSKATPNLH